MNGENSQGRKYTINYTDKDVAQYLLNKLLVQCMKEKHAEETKKIKELIVEHITSEKD